MAVADYGSHPTSLFGLSDEQLYAMYRASSWSKLDNDQRLELMQETVNRAAAAHGEIGAQQVTFKQYTTIEQTPSGPQIVPDTMTIAQNGRGGITVNSNLYTHGKDLTPWGTQDPAAGLNVLESLLHENEHAYQDQVIAGVIQAQDPAAARQYKANDFTNGMIAMEDGSLQPGSQYIMADTTSYQHDNYYLYYLSSTERDAFRFSQEKTLGIAKDQQAEILEEINELMAKNPDHYMETQEYQALRGDYYGAAAYITGQEQSGYDAMLQSAQEAYQDPNIEQDINAVLTNHFYNEQTKVPAHVEKAVNEAMVLSYQIQTGNAPGQTVHASSTQETQNFTAEEDLSQTTAATGEEVSGENAPAEEEDLAEDSALGESEDLSISSDEGAGMSSDSSGLSSESGSASEMLSEGATSSTGGSENSVEADEGMEM